MDRLHIKGGRRLQGTVRASGSKNASLPVLVSALLSDSPLRLSQIPDLQDIRTILKILQGLGLEVESAAEGVYSLKAPKILSVEASYDLVRTMRASVLVMGPLLAREGRARVSLPGGCAIGARPIDFHLKGFEALGATITLEAGYVQAEAKAGLQGANIHLPQPSVGATENLMMAAVLAKGTTRIQNAAREPEIQELAKALRARGAKIKGEGQENLEIEGVTRLGPVDWTMLGDRIEAATYLAAAVATRGDVTVLGIAPDDLESVLKVFEAQGAEVQRQESAVRVAMADRAKAVNVTTAPYPGFPTDMQAQVMAIATLAQGESVITETIFENRFMHVAELMRLGARVEVSGNQATIRGVERLIGAPVMATDLRASACLVVAGLCAEGETVVNRIYHLDRGYERLEKKLNQLGANVERRS